MRSFSFYGITKMPPHVLESLLQAGWEPDVELLAGWEFKGYNIGIAPKILRISKFKKGFLKVGDEVWGYNIPVVQNSIEEPYIPLPSSSSPRRFGWYKVYPAKFNPEFNKYKNALLLNYGEAKNPFWEPARFLVDYLVQVPYSTDLFLGKAYVRLGGKAIAVGYFVLERYNKAENVKLPF